MKEHGIYKYVYDGEIIYIGKTDRSILGRVRDHAKEAKFLPYLGNAEIYFFHCEDSIQTDIYEKVLINKYKPILNVDCKSKGNFLADMAEPEWIKIDALQKIQGCANPRRRQDGINKAALTKLNRSLSKKEGELRRLKATRKWVIKLLEEAGNDKKTGVHIYRSAPGDFPGTVQFKCDDGIFFCTIPVHARKDKNTNLITFSVLDHTVKILNCYHHEILDSMDTQIADLRLGLETIRNDIELRTHEMQELT